MKQKLKMPNFPVLKNPAIALRLDFRRKKEQIVLGNFDGINRYIRGAKKDKILFEETRPIGSFLLDMVPNPSYFANLQSLILDITKQQRDFNISLLEKLYESDNLLYKYIALKMWQEYNNISNGKQEPSLDRTEDLTLPFRYNLMSDILEWQRTNPYNPLIDMPYEYFKYPIQHLTVPKLEHNIEWVIADFALMPLIAYYLQAIYEKEKYFSYCKVCGKLFLAPDLHKTTMCSAKCRKKQKKINKQNYNERYKDVGYEKTQQNERMYWYNRIRKAKKLGSDEKVILKLEKEFERYKADSLEKKRQVKDGSLAYNEYANWLLEQRDVIDDLMEKHGLS